MSPVQCGRFAYGFRMGGMPKTESDNTVAAVNVFPHNWKIDTENRISYNTDWDFLIHTPGLDGVSTPSLLARFFGRIRPTEDLTEDPPARQPMDGLTFGIFSGGIIAISSCWPTLELTILNCQGNSVLTVT